jgi:hypothetical protein
MPALPSVPKVLQVTAHQTIGADTAAINRWFHQYAGGAPTAVQAAALATTISGNWGTLISPLQDTATSLTSVTVQDLSSPTAAFGQDLTVRAGTRAGSAEGADVCALIRESINRRYRGGHPRVYLRAGVVADLSTPQGWFPAFVLLVTNGWTAMQNNINAGVWVGGISMITVNVSYYQGFHNFTYPSGRVRALPTVRGAPVVDPIVAFACQSKPASQRRRTLWSA